MVAAAAAALFEVGDEDEDEALLAAVNRSL